MQTEQSDTVFVGRDKELELLQDEFDRQEYRMLVLYGRRRVGKTELLKQFIKDKRSVKFTAVTGNLAMNLSSFKKALPSEHKPEMINPDFEDLLDCVIDMSREERTILIIDEFPYLANSEISIASRLQIYIDDIMKNENIFLILCGSSISAMVDGVLGAKSPLYGRRTAQMELMPFNFRKSTLLLQGFSNMDQFRIYSIVGGIPLYLRLFDPNKTLDENIWELFLTGKSVLSNETEILLKEEMRSPEAYSALLEALSFGKSRISEIANYMGTDTAITSNLISNMTYIHIVEKIQPFGERSPKKTRYRIKDNLFRFYYRFIHGYDVSLEDEELKDTAKTICGNLNSYLGIAFEQVCREYCRHYLHWNKVGTWWGTDNKSRMTKEIDIVATDIYRKPERTLYCECKFDSKRIDDALVQDLIGKSKLIKSKNREYVLFYAVGDKPDISTDVRIVSLDEMYDDRHRG